MTRLDLTIDGMSCSHCLNAVRGALDTLPGVTVETVTLGRATVSYDPARVTLDEIVDAVNDEGYTASRASA